MHARDTEVPRACAPEIPLHEVGWRYMQEYMQDSDSKMWVAKPRGQSFDKTGTALRDFSNYVDLRLQARTEEVLSESFGAPSGSVVQQHLFNVLRDSFLMKARLEMTFSRCAFEDWSRRWWGPHYKPIRPGMCMG